MRIRDAIHFKWTRNAHVIGLVKSVTKEHLPMSSNLSNGRERFSKRTRAARPAFVSRRVPAGFATTCFLPASPPLLSRGRIRGYRKKTLPLRALATVKKIHIPQTGRGGIYKRVLYTRHTYTARRMSVFQDPGRWSNWINCPRGSMTNLKGARPTNQIYLTNMNRSTYIWPVSNFLDYIIQRRNISREIWYSFLHTYIKYTYIQWWQK